LSYAYPVYIIGKENSEWERERERESVEPIAWPPRSPNLTPVDFFLWGYVKNIVYQVQINELQHLKARIREDVATETLNMLQATWNEVEYRLDICRATKGAHI
jgi:hypothetical protein